MRLPVLLSLLIGIAAPGYGEDAPLIVHEWGTFTSLQDEDGNTVAGINTDDEPVPAFVHTVPDFDSFIDKRSLEPLQELNKGGVPMCHPDVTMRLETPVIYFYVPRNSWQNSDSVKLDVDVSFKGGWLTEFYPDAATNIDHKALFGHLARETAGFLSWKGLSLVSESDRKGPATDKNVWLAPRKVESTSVETQNGESEKFLFYRGVANVESPLQARRDTKGDLHIGNRNPAEKASQPGELWFVDIKDDGKLAFLTLEHGDGTVRSNVFSEKDYRGANPARLQQSLHSALVAAGLFPDEATAMLNTWQNAYFKTPGQRIFYIVPRTWVDEYLPIKFSIPTRTERVMIGRIDVISPAQGLLLSNIAHASPDAEMADFDRKLGAYLQNPENAKIYADVLTGKKPFSALGIEAPKTYGDYIKLGRFRNAIILNENHKRPTKSLDSFIKINRIAMYTIRQ